METIGTLSVQLLRVCAWLLLDLQGNVSSASIICTTIKGPGFGAAGMSPRRKRLVLCCILVVAVISATAIWIRFSWYGAALWRAAWPADKAGISRTTDHGAAVRHSCFLQRFTECSIIYTADAFRKTG